MISLIIGISYALLATVYPKPLRNAFMEGVKISEAANLPKPFRMTVREVDFYLSIPWRILMMLAGVAFWYFEIG